MAWSRRSKRQICQTTILCLLAGVLRIGLDFSFMYFYNPSLQKKYIDITAGDIKNNLAAEIQNNLNANYILLEKSKHARLNEVIKKDQKIFLVYEDTYFLIYKIAN